MSTNDTMYTLDDTKKEPESITNDSTPQNDLSKTESGKEQKEVDSKLIENYYNNKGGKSRKMRKSGKKMRKSRKMRKSGKKMRK
jgi:hypothetical protein